MSAKGVDAPKEDATEKKSLSSNIKSVADEEEALESEASAENTQNPNEVVEIDGIPISEEEMQYRAKDIRQKDGGELFVKVEGAEKLAKERERKRQEAERRKAKDEESRNKQRKKSANKKNMRNRQKLKPRSAKLLNMKKLLPALRLPKLVKKSNKKLPPRPLSMFHITKLPSHSHIVTKALILMSFTQILNLRSIPVSLFYRALTLLFRLTLQLTNMQQLPSQLK